MKSYQRSPLALITVVLLLIFPLSASAAATEACDTQRELDKLTRKHDALMRRHAVKEGKSVFLMRKRTDAQAAFETRISKLTTNIDRRRAHNYDRQYECFSGGFNAEQITQSSSEGRRKCNGARRMEERLFEKRTNLQGKKYKDTFQNKIETISSSMERIKVHADDLLAQINQCTIS